ncbi:hypothetical protein PENTCL1PPCAC_5111 [Pristionchus entomophagus]|uniref:Secreted protein n=1 Tax=Pristionchus entomophagus TaxID=358040 RepID=A0AAV5SI09_9BILA|nr:hypothetical protein PENTCL1PPCAC_5111 [Pristionchus entomophagus]
MGRKGSVFWRFAATFLSITACTFFCGSLSNPPLLINLLSVVNQMVEQALSLSLVALATSDERACRASMNISLMLQQ